MKQIYTFDDFLPAPVQYRYGALAGEFGSIEFSPTEIFHGIQMAGELGKAVTERIVRKFPTLHPTASFFRKSPAGQVEPTYIHSDAMMGDWTGILYLNETPAHGDGTRFWLHKESLRGSASLAEVPQFEESFQHIHRWKMWSAVDAKFNRLMMFPSTYFHSRSIPENYGEGGEARLIQVVFGTGVVP